MTVSIARTELQVHPIQSAKHLNGRADGIADGPVSTIAADGGTDNTAHVLLSLAVAVLAALLYKSAVESTNRPKYSTYAGTWLLPVEPS